MKISDCPAHPTAQDRIDLVNHPAHSLCKRETLQEAYRLAKANDGAPGIDGVTFAAVEAEGVFSTSFARSWWGGHLPPLLIPTHNVIDFDLRSYFDTVRHHIVLDGLRVSIVRDGCGARPRWSFRAPWSGLRSEYRPRWSAFRLFCAGSASASRDGNPADATQPPFPA